MENKKHRVIEELLAICEKKQDFTFHNDLVKKVSSRIGFGNPFDVTKLDNKEKLPDILLQKKHGNYPFRRGIP